MTIGLDIVGGLCVIRAMCQTGLNIMTKHCTHRVTSCER
jgi:hypothetical protein